MPVPTPQARNGLQADRIVEVPRIGRIDGERETLPQVAVPRRQRAVLVEHRASRLRKRPFGEHRLQLVTGDHHVYGRVLVVGEPEHLLDNAGGRRVARRKRRDAHAHERSVFDVGPVGTHGEYVIGDVRIFGHDHAERFGHLVAPHERVVRTVDDRSTRAAGFSPARRSALRSCGCFLRPLCTGSGATSTRSPSNAPAILDSGTKNSPSAVCTKPKPPPRTLSTPRGLLRGCRRVWERVRPTASPSRGTGRFRAREPSGYPRPPPNPPSRRG